MLTAIGMTPFAVNDLKIIRIVWDTGEVRVRDFNEWFCTFCSSVLGLSAMIVGVLIRTSLRGIMEWQAQKVQDREPEGFAGAHYVKFQS